MTTNESTTVTDSIRYLTGLLQGDCLALVLFTICVNPLAHLLNITCDGYMAGPPGERNNKITNLLFVDDLKTYSNNRTDAMRQLELITQFTNDIGMQFGADKCAYLNIEKGQKRQLNTTIEKNGLRIQELKNDESYKYLGMDEDIAFRGELTKDRVKKEYFRRVKRIWRSELYGKNKVIAHNIFATPVFTLTFGVLEWTKEEVLQVDVQTRKILTYTGNFHRNSSVPRLYGLRTEGGRGLNSIYDIFITRMIALHHHLEEASSWNHYLGLVLQHETTRIVRISKELQTALEVDGNRVDVSQATKDTIKKQHIKTYQERDQHA